MDYIPYSRQSITEQDIQAVCAVLRSDLVTQGPVVPAFEEAFAQIHGVENAVAVSNATAGLHLACLALGVGPGGRVWTSPISFLASANCALYCGASIDFVDIDPISRNISVTALAEKLELAALCGELPQVVIPVDFAGLPCDLREIRILAQRYGFRILEDASHATGAAYLGRPVGSSFADASVFSFHAVKIITTAEGGMITTNDHALAHKLRLLRSHGMTRELSDMRYPIEGPWVYEQHVLGFNYRLTDVLAALGYSQLQRLSTMQAQRAALADNYNCMLKDLPLILPVRLPDRMSAWHLYVIEIDSTQAPCNRADVFKAFREAQIGVNVHYIPIHTQPYYASLGFKPGDFPVAERYYSRAISLPIFPEMNLEQQDKVVMTLRKLLLD
jgi:UDP-4-amino-4,6-dideoxy-N-acetyl-beta-L-altrosamine transaminase